LISIVNIGGGVGLNNHEICVGTTEDIRKDLRKTAKRLIKQGKKHPNMWSKEDVMYAKMIKKQNKKRKDGNDCC
tara:strand:- start:684 stop:905 length:222 start_codon:yes stop_codon:yes gene_type:complete